MKLKAVSGIMLILLLIGMLTLTFNIQPVEASGTIYIRADGSIDPPTARISTVDNVIYTFTGNIYDEIVVERDNIVVDGAGYIVEGSDALLSRGIDLSLRHNVALKNVEVKRFYYGIYLEDSSNNTITGDNATHNQYGISIRYSSNNTLTGNIFSYNTMLGMSLFHSNNNTLTDNHVSSNNNIGGIWLQYSNSNIIIGNAIHWNWGVGISLGCSNNNIIFHNTFQHNTVWISSSNSTNVWDDGYPSGGNYWREYTDVDQYSGPSQNINGSDGIWDHPYVIDENNQDNYPIVPEFPTWTSILIILIVLTVAIAVYKRRLLKTPIH